MMLRVFRNEKYRRFSFYFLQGLLFLFFLNLVLLFFYLVGNYQDLQDKTILGIMYWLSKTSLLYIVLGILFLVEFFLERAILKKGNWRSFVFVVLSLVLMIPVYLIMVVSGNLVTQII